MLEPMLRVRDPLGSVSVTLTLAVMSEKPRMLYDYFKQRFAQVTNPPIDSIREEVIMALECYVGPERNLLESTPEHAQRLRLPHPIISNDELAALSDMEYRGWRSKTIDITYPITAADNLDSLREALQRIGDEAKQAIADGYSLVILSDRAIAADRGAMSALLAVGTVHHAPLVAVHMRSQIGLVIETGEAGKFTTTACSSAMAPMRSIPTSLSKRYGTVWIGANSTTLLSSKAW